MRLMVVMKMMVARAYCRCSVHVIMSSECHQSRNKATVFEDPIVALFSDPWKGIRQIARTKFFTSRSWLEAASSTSTRPWIRVARQRCLFWNCCIVDARTDIMVARVRLVVLGDEGTEDLNKMLEISRELRERPTDSSNSDYWSFETATRIPH